MRNLVRGALGCFVLMAATPGRAADLPFTGTVTGISTLVGVDPTCAPLQYRSVISPASTIGFSSLGNFTFGTSTCLSLGGGSSFGTFTMNFGSDAFGGTFDGGSTPSDTAGISDTAWLFTILNGTGRFAGASGTFEGAGLADARTRPTHVAIAFIGNVITPAVPEPETWEMMLLGFGVAGIMVRRRRHRLLRQSA